MVSVKVASIDDLNIISRLENEGFPSSQAATKETLRGRLNEYGDHFLIAYKESEPVGYIGGLVCDEPLLTDELYDNPKLHREDGDYQMVFSVVVTPKRQGEGIGHQLILAMSDLAKKQSRKGVVLTCLEEKISFYEEQGFENKGVSKSDHGGAVWYDMVKSL